jgi:LysM repeat protein
VTAIAAQYVTVLCTNPPLRVRALRGNVAPIPAGGFGGWQLVARPRRKALTQWGGIDPFQLQLSIILDGVRGNQSVEPDCLALEQMAQPIGPRLDPPTVTVVGVVPHPELDYVIGDGNGGSGLAWDAAPLYSASGYRIRQEVTLTLVEYVAADRVGGTSPAARARAQAVSTSAAAAAAAGGVAPAARVYTIKAGDTLTGIAARVLGSATRWTELAQLNGLEDPYRLPVGATVRLP